MQHGYQVYPEYRSLIDALAEIRTDLGVSQRELARRVNKPPSFINKIEMLERRLDILEFIVIAEALGYKADDLIRQIRSNLSVIIDISRA